MSTTNYNCDQCGKPCTAKTVIYNRYKTHFCGKECKAAHQRGAKDRAKDERIRELEKAVNYWTPRADAYMEELQEVRRERDAAIRQLGPWTELAENRLKDVADSHAENKALEQRNRKLRVLAWAGWIGCIVYVSACLYANNGWHLPTTKPDAGELVIGRQGESRTPHIAYVDSLGEWHDWNNGKKLEVTKWSRP